ncbi:MAG: hypothetical protein KY431_01185 [Actinobacteria bacterium]|nr:hypothetical protein [Actinomycetota bacterium]
MARSRGARRLVAVMVTNALVSTACGGSGFQYIKNDEFNAYFKIDEDWTVFDERAYFSSPAIELDPLERQRKLATTWVRGFDGSDRPSLANLFVNATPDPHGVARIQLLTEAERESVDVASLRSAHLGFDPVQANREDPQGPVEVLMEQDVSLEGGQHGVRMAVAFDTPSGEIAIVDQTALVDSSNRILYLFVIGCSRQCYAQHRDTIDEIAASWTIEEE